MGLVVPEEQQPNLNATDESYNGGMIVPNEQTNVDATDEP